MPNFQQQVNAYPAKGVPGDRASLNPHVYVIGNPLAEGHVTLGRFVWDGSEIGLAKNSGTGKPLGFVERVLAYYDLDLGQPGGLATPDRAPLLVARKGDYYAVAVTAAIRGQKIFAVLADGSGRWALGAATTTCGDALGESTTAAGWLGTLSVFAELRAYQR